jgi:glucose/mannose-6-phosphate isomerase
VAAAVTQLKARRHQLASAGRASQAATIAKRIGRTIPLVHGGGLLGATAASRWKCQVNENPKSPAFCAVQPELCHNEVTGWGQHGDVTRQLITVVMLRHSYEHPQVARRFELVAGILDEVVADIVQVPAAGEGRLAQLFDLTLIGDVVALELAAREGIDPGPIPILSELKAALAASTQ